MFLLGREWGLRCREERIPELDDSVPKSEV